jgi:hypothetical protein
MPRKRRIAKVRLTQLNGEQEMELLIGDGGKSAFSSERERREAWSYHRERLIATVGPGVVPWAMEVYG